MAELRRYNPKSQKWEPIGANTDIVAPAYDSVSASYSIDDLVIENNKLYSAKEFIAAPAGQFNPSKWNETDIASAKADLVDGKVPVSQLPSYVDDVVEYATYNDLPQEGEQGKIYVVLSDNKVWRWSGSTYIEIAANEIFKELVITGSGISRTSNYTASELIQFVDEGKTLIYDSCLLKEISRATTPQRSITFQYLNPQNTTVYNIGIFEDKGATFSTNLNIPTELNAKASKSSVDAIKNGVTINNFGGVESALGNKIDEPASEGSDGYVLTTDGNGGRSWAPTATVEDNTTLVIKPGEEDLTIYNIYQMSGRLNKVVKIRETRNGVTEYHDYIPVDYIKTSNDEYVAILIRKYVASEDIGTFGSSNGSYYGSTAENWCNNTFKNYLSDYIKGQLRNVPCSIAITNGSSTMISASVFLPPSYHMGGPNNNDSIDGSYTKWFGNYATDSDRVAQLEGGSGGTRYWLSAYDSTYSGIYYNHKVIYVDGSFGYLSDTSTSYYRPVIAVSSSTPVVQTDENTFVTEGTNYTAGTVDTIKEAQNFYKIKDTEARAEIAGITNGQTLNSFGEVEAELDTLVAVKDGTDLVINGSDEGGSGGTNTPLKDFAIGSTIQIKESGTFVNFKLVEKETIDGNIVVTLLKETATDSGSIGTSTIVTYDNSTSDNWCRNTYYNRLTEYVQGYTVSKPIKCRTKTMVSTINRKCFLPSAYELGIGTYIDGNSIWFSNDSQRNTGAAYWTRTYRAYESGYNCYYYVTATGASDATTGAGPYYMNYGYRPCLAFSGDTPVNASNQIDEGSITYTDTIDKLQDGDDYYKFADQDVRAMLAAPSADGTYTLKCTVSSGVATIEWVSDST